jgi:nucleoside-diphosphate-sugar epimerase
MSILVTGATGLTGHFVVEELLRRGHAVRALCRPAAAGGVAAGAEVAVGDLTDADSLARAARGVDAIVHTAVTRGDSAVDIAAMEALLASWRTGPFVYMSSLDVYGFAGPELITEDTPLSESYNDYATSKVVCERMLAEAAGRGGRVDHVSLRAPYIWGPHTNARERLVTPRLREGLPIILPGADEAQWREYRDVWIDVRDLVAIVAACVERPTGGALNVLSGHFVWHDLFAHLIRLTGSRSQIVHRPVDQIGDDELPGKANYAQAWQFSQARLEAQLGVFPRRPLEQTLRDTVS